MAVFSIIKLSELEGAKQLAPEFYHPAKTASKRYLENAGRKKIKDCFYNVREIFDPKKKNLNQQAIIFDLSDVTSYFLGGGKKATSSEEVGSSKKIFYENDVLISRLRPYLKEVSFIGFDGKLKLASTEFVVLRQRDRNYYPETLFAFLISKEVQNILVWSITGTEHPRFNEDYFLKLTLPDLSKETQEKIKATVQFAWKIFLDSLELYSQAENLLLEELGLKDFKPKYKKTYTANLSDVFSAYRIDAEYFQPAYEEVIEKINKQVELKPLIRLAERITTKIKPAQDKIYQYIEISDVLTDIGEVGFTKRLGRDLPPNARIPVNGGELIISKVRPTRGAIGIIPFNLANNLICSSAFSIFNVDSPLKEYIYIVVRSIIGRLQLEKPTAGTSYPTINDKDVENLKIPLLPLSTQQKIASLVQQSHDARRKAKELLEEAKKKVEDAIEKGNNKASALMERIE